MQITSLITWYNREKRSLPWRENTDPYRIWISEIMLQQTRVDQVINYFNRFMEQFPDIEHLAKASEDHVLKQWQGLGYYSRARNIHKTAKIIYTENQGYFPQNIKALKSLPGIGEYTSGAIASIAFNIRTPAVDGNVQRVLARIFLIKEPVNTTHGARIINNIAQDIIPENDPGTFNQALMELGALICTPSSPSCPVCPVRDFCFAFRKNLADSLPNKIKKTKYRNRYFNYLILRNNDHTFIYQRNNPKDIWYHLYEFPLYETSKIVTPEHMSEYVKTQFPAIAETLIFTSVVPLSVHTLSHQKLYARFYIFNYIAVELHPKNWTKIHFSEIDSYPTHSLTIRFLDNYKFD